jgi:phenylalanyl-tRNA synthetase alpha chain
MAHRPDDLLNAFAEDAKALPSMEALEALRVKYLSRKAGLVTELFKAVPGLPPEERKGFGARLNEVKAAIEGRLEQLAAALRAREEEERLRRDRIDVTLPGVPPETGMLHPITRVRRQMEGIFRALGYSVEDAPEIEDDWHNFTALNLPEDHPARDAQDTFYLRAPWLLRTHTSNVQIRSMKRHQPPLMILAPGRVFRRDDSPRHSPMFHQIEGLAVDRGLSFAHFKATLEHFLRQLFDESVIVRFQPSYYPFTEPSADVVVSCIFCAQKGCRVCSHTGWVEIMGSGMVHPQVLRNVGWDPDRWRGFAFGMGIDRVAMIKYGMPNIRLHFEANARMMRGLL